MNKNKKIVNINEAKRKIPENNFDPKSPVTHEELQEIFGQLSDNYLQLYSGVLDDMNAMYANQIFPFQIRMAATERVLVDKGILTADEIDLEEIKYKKEIRENSQQVRENENGILEVVPKEEAEVNEKKAIVKTNLKKSKK